MRPEKIVAWLEALGCDVPKRQTRAGWIVSDCPMGWRHKNGRSAPERFGVQIGQGVCFCSCWSCDYHGDQDDVIIDLHARDRQTKYKGRDFKRAVQMIEDCRTELDIDLTIPDYETRLFAEKIPLYAFPEKWLASFPLALDVKSSSDYLRERGVPDALAEALDLRCDVNKKRVCFPVRDFDGVLRGLHGRAMLAGVEPRYRMYPHQDQTNPICWLGEAWVDVDKPVLFVEGPFDLASVARVFRNTITPLFASISFEKLQRVSGILRAITLFDSGEAGDRARDKVSICLPDSSLTHLKPPPGVKDPGEMDVGQLSLLLGPHVDLDEIIE